MKLFEHCSSIYGVHLKPAGIMNSPFTNKSTLVMVVDNEGQQYVLKKIHPAYFQISQPEDYLQGIHYYQNFLVKNKVPLAPYLLTIQNKIFTVFENSVYTLMHFVEGTSYNGTKKQVGEVARMHGHLNTVLTTMDTQRYQFIQENNRNVFFDQQKSLSLLYEQVQNRLKAAPTTPSTSLLLESLPFVSKVINALDDNLYAGLPTQVAHKDVFPGNVLFTSQGAVLLDPDEVCFMPRIRDVGYAIWGFASRRPPAPGVFPLDTSVAVAYLGAYQQVAPLLQQERKILPQIMVRIWLEDVLHYALISSLTKEDYSNVQRKLHHLKHAVMAGSDISWM